MPAPGSPAPVSADSFRSVTFGCASCSALPDGSVPLVCVLAQTIVWKVPLAVNRWMLDVSLFVYPITAITLSDAAYALASVSCKVMFTSPVKLVPLILATPAGRLVICQESVFSSSTYTVHCNAPFTFVHAVASLTYMSGSINALFTPRSKRDRAKVSAASWPFAFVFARTV